MKINIEDTWKDVENIKINVPDYNLTGYQNWIDGTTGSISGVVDYSTRYTEYADNGTLNRRILETGPFGDQVVCWQALSGSSQYGNVFGGFNMAATSTNYQGISIDNTKTYRVSMWIKRKNVTSGQGNVYFGIWALSGGTREYITSTPTYIYTSNPYPISTSATQTNNIFPENEWRLCVAHLRPYDTLTGTTLHIDTGVYKPDGTKITTGLTLSDYIFSSETYETGLRVSNPYNIPRGSTATGYFLYPRIDLCDGTEPSITALLSNEGGWRDVDSTQINIGDTWKTIT